MRKSLYAILATLAAVLMALPGCVELTGQRISWFYDQDHDELQVLLHYDGIHDSGSAAHQSGAKQIPQFVDSGSIMLLDWPLHIDMDGLRQKAENESLDARERRWAKLFTTCKAEPIGHYREPDGRVGAAQFVRIPKASQFIRDLNALISEEIGDNAPEEGPTWPAWQVRSLRRRGHTKRPRRSRFPRPRHGLWTSIGM